jgi:hypothetical protein
MNLQSSEQQEAVVDLTYSLQQCVNDLYQQIDLDTLPGHEECPPTEAWRSCLWGIGM